MQLECLLLRGSCSLAFRPSLGPCTARSRGGSDVKVTPLWCLGAVESTTEQRENVGFLGGYGKTDTVCETIPILRLLGSENGEV